MSRIKQQLVTVVKTKVNESVAFAVYVRNLQIDATQIIV